MTKEHLRELRDTELGINSDGDVVFTKRDKKRTRVYGPVSFKEAMVLCWAVMKDYMEEMKNE